MKKRVCLMALGLSLACVTGCGNTIVEISEENQQLVAEYAAGLLLKYNTTGNSRILEGQELVKEEAKEVAAAEREQKRLQAAADYEASKGQPKENGSSGNGGNGSGTTTESYLEDIAPLFGWDNFSIRYTNYEIADSYPNGDREDMFMAMDATLGKKLLVAKFAVTNEGGQAEDFDMFEKQGKFRLNTADGSYASQYTLLLDDLSVYKGVIEAGQTEEMVLIFEVPETLAENPGEPNLSVKCGDSRGNILLK